MNEELQARYLEGEPLDDAELALLVDDRAELDAIAVLLADVELWEEPSASLEDDIVDLIRTESHVVRLPAPTTPARPTWGTSATNLRSLHPSRRRVLRSSLLSAAAAAVIAAGATAVVLRDGQNGPPSQFESALPDGQPGRVRVADTASGLRIELDAPRLERLADGQFYQAWLRSVDGNRLVAVGTFHSGNDVILWAGVKLQDFPTLTVTIEPDDGNPASSGNRVLAVPLTP